MAVWVEGRKRGEFGVVAGVGVVILAGLVDFWRGGPQGQFLHGLEKMTGAYEGWT